LRNNCRRVLRDDVERVFDRFDPSGLAGQHLQGADADQGVRSVLDRWPDSTQQILLVELGAAPADFERETQADIRAPCLAVDGRDHAEPLVVVELVLAVFGYWPTPWPTALPWRSGGARTAMLPFVRPKPGLVQIGHRAVDVVEYPENASSLASVSCP